MLFIYGSWVKGAPLTCTTSLQLVRAVSSGPSLPKLVNLCTLAVLTKRDGVAWWCRNFDVGCGQGQVFAAYLSDVHVTFIKSVCENKAVG